jgi:hypothetical protein
MVEDIEKWRIKLNFHFLVTRICMVCWWRRYKSFNAIRCMLFEFLNSFVKPFLIWGCIVLGWTLWILCWFQLSESSIHYSETAWLRWTTGESKFKVHTVGEDVFHILHSFALIISFRCWLYLSEISSSLGGTTGSPWILHYFIRRLSCFWSLFALLENAVKAK